MRTLFIDLGSRLYSRCRSCTGIIAVILLLISNHAYLKAYAYQSSNDSVLINRFIEKLETALINADSAALDALFFSDIEFSRWIEKLKAENYPDIPSSPSDEYKKHAQILKAAFAPAFGKTKKLKLISTNIRMAHNQLKAYVFKLSCIDEKGAALNITPVAVLFEGEFKMVLSDR
jgi:hypothetical protein